MEEIPHEFFLITPENSTCFLIDPWNLHMLFFQYISKFHVLNPPYPCFFLEQQPNHDLNQKIMMAIQLAMLELLHFRTPLELELGAVKLSAAFFNDESSITIGGGTKVQQRRYARVSYYTPISTDRCIICIAIILLNFKG